ncbi:hypothetical protein ASG22_11700 [Chryseobacterium sp. Leaf405]|uniref:DUF4836 family protein n=1 Tax=Chryseobacterium sp. Leaf405 TaxID=1736367 RepID=UPI0006F66E87|nr:DUF4836 family protein [Chryseobacterium sp. Leaf405]KQT24650.1 hypothetical protein ASG22_11700 [Chryseobacterium sp. Leaf405]
MKNTLMKSLFYVFAFAVLFSCNSNKNNEILTYTTDATLGLSRVNLKTISDKIPVDKILKEKKNLKDDDKFFLQLVSKPKESGIDTDKPLYFIVDQGKSTNDPDPKAFFWINDKAKFQKSMSDLTKSKVTIDKKDYIYVDGKLTGSIKGDLAVVSSEKSYNPYAGYNSYNTQEPSAKLNEKYFTDFWARKATSNDAIKDQVNQSLVDNKDISGWVNLAAVASYASKGYIETLAVNKLIKDSGIGFDFNFDKGKADMETKTFFNSDMKKVVEKYYDKNKVNYDLVKNVELDNAKSFTIGFFSLDFMRYLVKEAGFEATINHYLASTNKTLEDITSTFTGDYAFIDFKTIPTDTMDYYQPRNNAFVLGFNPKKKDNLMSLLAGPLGQGKKYMIADDEVLFSEDNNIINQFQNKKAGKNSKLDKKSGITAYSWSDGTDYNQKHNATTIKVVDMTNESKEDGGNLVSKTVFTLDKKDENALYYLIMNG